MTDTRDTTGTPIPGDVSEDPGMAALSVSAVSVRLGVSERTVRRYIARGTLPAERVHGDHGLEYRIRPAAVRDLEGQRAAIVHQPITRPPEPDTSAALTVPAFALVAPLVQELTAAREQLERLARENGDLRAQLRIQVQGNTGTRPWWRRIFGR